MDRLREVLGSGKLTKIVDGLGVPNGNAQANANAQPVWIFGYDKRGNVISRDGGRGPVASYTFDAANRLVAIPGTAEYRYDGHGRRVRQQSSGKDRFSLYTLDGVYRGGLDATASKLEWQVHLGSSLIATHSTPVGGGAASVRFHHTDALGSPVVETGPDGLEISGTRTRYSPYGEALNRTIDGPGYTGHVMDGESGLVYMQQRFYDPQMGRFLSVDPIAPDMLSGLGFARYT